MIRKALFTGAAALALVGLSAAPSMAQYSGDDCEAYGGCDPALSVDKEQVAQGGTYTLSGEGFEGETTYEIGSIYAGENPDANRALPAVGGADDLATVTTDADGFFTIDLDVAADADLGFYDIGIDENIAPTGETGPEGEIVYSAITSVRIEVVAAVVPVPGPGNNGPGNDGPGNNGPGNNGPGNNGPGNDTNGGSSLPRTGSSTLPLVGTGLGLLAAGGALLFANKRRSMI